MRKILMFLMFFIFLLLTIVVVLQLPPVGDPHVPSYAGYLPPDVPVEEITKQSNAVGLYYNRGAIKNCGSPSAITAMILDYRGYDTLYETTVIFLAMIAALSVLVGKRKKEEDTETWIGVTRYTIVGTVIKKIVPFMVMYGLYVIFHGEVSPGGGFQGGVILGASFVLYALIFSYEEGEKKMPSDTLRIVNALGPFMYALVGLIGIVTGYTFLANKVIKTIPHGIEGTLFSSLPLLLIELGIGFGVGSIITHIFYGYVTERPLDTQK
ncbi:MAG TPA: hypothetical protein DHV62_07465 [Elusimicrobia bacterium]|jgi:multicomponent Na+:H+ antiporter subunit B|nr:hypothetical protein [Elusimicrobiota bacterium]